VTEVWAVYAVALLPWSALAYLRLKRFLHILQLEEYLTPQYLRWLSERTGAYLRPWFVIPAVGGSVIAVIFVLIGSIEDGFSGLDLAGAVLWLLVGAQQLAIRLRDPWQAKKPLVMTARARRILVVAVLLGVALVAFGVGFGLLSSAGVGVAVGIFEAAVFTVLAGQFVALANLVLWPLEERSRRRFQRMAAAKLAEGRPRIIAITGSAGKTTTKELVAHLLSGRYRVLRTPASFNTPLGIARTVNDSYDGQDIFVVEMGAYKRGEIKKLCDLVGGTDVSAITTVNAQHLERFGSLDATAEAKYEIVEGLHPGGAAVLNYDVPALRQRVLAEGGRENLISFGVESDDVTLRGSNVTETPEGIEFDVTRNGETVHLKTRLLARHNAYNVLAAMGIGLSSGLDLEYMAGAIRGFTPPDHRLQPFEAGNGVTVLDDAYNANPEGIIGAIEVMGRYAPRRRILVTPGLIEMGPEKGAYHARIGEAAAANVDLAFLVGPRQTADIRAAILAAGFPEASLHTTRSFDEARETLGQIGAPGDVILYANDLPDQFDEFLVI
jgi:UDP-N-acetylmuramoyl-tripeptide--D-alanyl-D-alanine ligase